MRTFRRTYIAILKKCRRTQGNKYKSLKRKLINPLKIQENTIKEVREMNKTI